MYFKFEVISLKNITLTSNSVKHTGNYYLKSQTNTRKSLSYFLQLTLLCFKMAFKGFMILSFKLYLY